MKTNYLSILITTVFVLSIAGRAADAGSPVNDASTSTSNSSTLAAVQGVVKFAGTVPKPARIDMSADPYCAKVHPSPVMAEDIVTGANGGLENAIVFIADGLGDRTFQPRDQPVVIEQKGCMYQPRLVVLRANQPLRVVNSDKTTHNIHPMPQNNREWNKSQPPGVLIEESFPREEIAIPVKCNVHPWMRGYVAVLKHPFFAVTAKDGTFNLRNLPPGTYTVEAWHGKLGTATQKITIGAGETKMVQFVFKPQPGS